MKNFRTYPWWLQLTLFLLMVFTMLSFCSFLLIALVPKIAGVGLDQIQRVTEGSPFSLIKTSVIVQGVFSLSIFALPALLFAYLAHPQPARYVGLRKPVKGLHLLLSVLLILGAMPILEEIQALVSHIDLGASVKESQAASEAMMKSFLTMPSFVDFLRAFLVMAIIPAAGEELFFRGVLMRFAYKGTKSMWFSVLFTSFIFASTHSNVYGLFSIFLAGALLASIYYLTSSIWCGILAHMCFNGTQVVLSYFAKSSPAVKAMVESDSISIGLLVAGALVFSGALYLLLKTKTPLAPTWADDFDTPPPPAQFPGFDSLS